MRETVRTVQELRQKADLSPKDRIALYLDLPGPLKEITERHEDLLKKEVNAKSVEWKRTEKFSAEMETKLEDKPAWLALRKI